MLNIGQFFKRIQNKHGQEAFLHALIQQVIEKHTGATVMFERKAGEIVTRNVPAALKSQLFIKRTLILRDINTQQQNVVITHIK
jgi:hypothetical protein